MFTVMKSEDRVPGGYFLSVPKQDTRALIYLKDFEKYEHISLPEDLFRVEYIAGKNIERTNRTKDKLWFHVADRNHTGSALFSVTSLLCQDYISPSACHDVIGRNPWGEYINENDDDHIDFLSLKVQEISKKIASGFTSEEKTNAYWKASKIFAWVRENISYSLFPLHTKIRIQNVIASLPENERVIQTILLRSFDLLPDEVEESLPRVVIPPHITDPYEQVEFVFGSTDLFFKTLWNVWEEKGARMASKIIENKVGKCDCFSHAFVALCRSMEIPAKVIIGFCNRTEYHAWAVVSISPYGWIPVDVTNERLICYFTNKNYSYEILGENFSGKYHVLSTENPLDKNDIRELETFFKNSAGNPTEEELKKILTGK